MVSRPLLPMWSSRFDVPCALLRYFQFFNQVKRRYDSTAKLWRELPTGAELAARQSEAETYQEVQLFVWPKTNLQLQSHERSLYLCFKSCLLIEK